MHRCRCDIIKYIKIIQEFLKYVSYFDITNKGTKELLLVERTVHIKIEIKKRIQINRLSSWTRKRAFGFSY